MERSLALEKQETPIQWMALHPNMIIGASTEVHGGAGLIATAGGIDTHIHFICPQQIDHALFSGITTMIGGGTGPADGTNATTVTPGAWNIQKMLEAAEAFPDEPWIFWKRKLCITGTAWKNRLKQVHWD